MTRTATTERADVLAAIDSRIRACTRAGELESARRFQAFREDIFAGLHERNDQ